MERTAKDAWKPGPLPKDRVPLDYSRVLNQTEAARIRDGLIPRDVEGRWRIVFDRDWLLFYRSLTGLCIYGLKLEPFAEGMRVVESWVNCDPREYLPADRALEHAALDRIIEGMS